MKYQSEAETSRPRPTIGLLVHGAGDPNNSTIWAGVADVAREQSCNPICFPGKPLRSLIGFESQSNVVFDLIDVQRLDGLVIWLAGLAHHADQRELKEFCERYKSVPVVTVGTFLEGFPGVLVDNYRGMRDVVSHIVLVHRRSRIAFIRGPERHQEAEQRYQAYLDVLTEHGVPIDPELVVLGNFRESGGTTAIEELLDRRQVRFDALIAASDNMAIGAMKVLQARGIRIPGEIAIAGLNDEAQSRFVTPPLTTGPLHFYEQARRGTEMVLALIRGETVAERVVIPTELRVRQSCGCLSPSLVYAGLEADEKPPVSASDKAFFFTQFFVAQNEMIAATSATKTTTDLSNTFMAEIKATRGATELPTLASGVPESSEFLALLAETLREAASGEQDVFSWNDFISLLRRTALSTVAETERLVRAENLLHQARVLIGETAQRVQAYQTLLLNEKLQMLSQINQELSITTHLSELARVLSRTILLLDIPRCYLSLYEDPQYPVEWARLVVAYDETGQIPLPEMGLRFPSRQLIPDGFLSAERQYSLIVEPLYFREDQLGFVLFEADPRDDEIYEILGAQISGAVKRTILTERNIRLYHEAVEARKAAEEANRLKSRFLSMVSHELRTPLSLIVGTIEMMLQEEKARSSSKLPNRYRRDMNCIYASAQHLSRLIGDVLDLAGSQAGALKLVCEPLSLTKILQDVAVLGESMAREKGLEWRAEIPGSLPLVWGDRTRLRQVTLNLISNAVKFTERGSVELNAQVEDGKLTVSVKDTGMGIPLEEQESIFDEFQRSERSLGRGYGGIGLGLAISRRLIELHSGKIGVYSTGVEESGSTFYYTLPILTSACGEPTPTPKRSQTVLLLTEDMGRAQRLHDHLAQRGYEVETVSVRGHPDWLCQLVASPPGAVVMDCQPAAEYGWELVKLLKQGDSTRDIPVVFYSFLENRDSGSVLEMDYLTKPLRSTDLSQTLERFGLKSHEEKSILIVDDEPNILDMHARMLEKELPTYRILKAHNGREALQILEQNRTDLVLLDLMMPEVDGFEVLERMRDRKSTRNVPVVVLTAQILSSEDMRRLQSGVAAVLGKELFSASEVMAQVEAALSRSKRLSRETQQVVRQAMAYINEHYASPLSRNILASRLGVSENYLTRCFKQELGITPTTYLNRFRIKQAKDLLDSGHSNITEVAFLCGFSDSNYFARVFRREVGAPPSAYLSRSRSS